MLRPHLLYATESKLLGTIDSVPNYIRLIFFILEKFDEGIMTSTRFFSDFLKIKKFNFWQKIYQRFYDF